VEPGEVVEVAIRPQHILISEMRAGDPITLTGRVEAHRFLGNVVHYAIRLPSEDIVLVETAAEAVLPAVGRDVSLTWRKDHALLFDAQGQALYAK
jgi:ABC-type Fe3+/spermidine/putrescine transport system ATPase subunit